MPLTDQAVEAGLERADLRFDVARPALWSSGRSAVEGLPVLRGGRDDARADAEFEGLFRVQLGVAQVAFVDGGAWVDRLRRGAVCRWRQVLAMFLDAYSGVLAIASGAPRLPLGIRGPLLVRARLIRRVSPPGIRRRPAAIIPLVVLGRALLGAPRVVRVRIAIGPFVLPFHACVSESNLTSRRCCALALSIKAS